MKLLIENHEPAEPNNGYVLLSSYQPLGLMAAGVPDVISAFFIVLRESVIVHKKSKQELDNYEVGYQQNNTCFDLLLNTADRDVGTGGVGV